jgi:hypothetical protein
MWEVACLLRIYGRVTGKQEVEDVWGEHALN